MKREPVMLCQKYDPKKNHIGTYFMSQKLDGIRCFWDGGISRGLPCSEIPYANTEKNYRLKEEPISTGLWTRLFHPIHAPDWFINQLPNFFLDGELFCPSGSWQTLSSIVKRFTPDDSDWGRIEYRVIDSPFPDQIFADGIIKTTNMKKTFNGIDNWIKERRRQVDLKVSTGERSFQFIYERLKKVLVENDCVQLHTQIELPHRNFEDIIEAKLTEVVEAGGEGLVFRAPWSLWTPERSHNLLKWKPVNDAEVTITGYIWGKETNLGSKLLGLVGAFITDFRGQRLELSGFTEEERILHSKGTLIPNIDQYIRQNAGKEVDTNLFESKQFPIGSRITIKYRELSDKGLAKEARYYRKPI